jgi:hypothetical protein
MTNEEGPVRETGPATTTTTAILTRRPPDWRSRRRRKYASRHLDELLGHGLDPWQWTQPIGDVFADGGLSWRERQLRGEALLAVGWMP